jgi:indole-3-glycerol phosphate synthase
MKRLWNLIAEVKTQSPFGFESTKSWDELFAVANKYGDVISIHTDPRWGGSFDMLRKARELTTKPILAKGIHATDEDIIRAISAGADYVLVVGRVPKAFIEKCWLEPNYLAELAAYPKYTRVVWNQRDLKTGKLKRETFAQARVKWPDWLCQASMLRTVADVDTSASAVLVGTYLEDFVNSL